MLLPLLCVGLVSILPQDPPAPDSSLTKPLAGSLPGTERWIVLLKDGAIPADEMRATLTAENAQAADLLDARIRAAQAGFVDDVEQLGARVTAQWWLVNGLALEIAPDKVGALRSDARVAYVHPDLPRRQGIKRSTNLQNHATDLVHRLGFRGKDIVVGIVDSGLDMDMNATGRPHATFYPDGDVNNRTGGGINGSRVLANIQAGKLPPEDPISHGTSVAAIVAGARWNQTSVAADGHAPEARIVSYSVVDFPNGYASVQSLTNAWQQMAIDAPRYKISVANCSYEGYFLPLADQLAIDVLASTMNIVVVGMAGNGGASSEYAYGATNMIAVGAVAPDTRAVAPFSTRGPLLNDAERAYPDLVANGVDIVMPVADNEAGSRMSQGTSYASAQVAGLAALLRTMKLPATPIEVKAALAATSQDVSAQNPLPPFNSRNAYGAGYARAPQLQQLALGLGLLRTAGVSATTPVTFPLDVEAGSKWNVAITWFRRPEPTTDWSNLDLEVLDGTNVIASSTTKRTLLEFVRFTAPKTGQLTLRVTGTSLQSGLGNQLFAIAAFSDDGLQHPGLLATFGKACLATTPSISLLPTADVPRVGDGYTLRAQQSQFPLPNPMLLLTGFSATTWGPFSLPFDLTGLGAPTCFVYTSTDLVTSIPISTGGPSFVVVTVPSLPGLIGLDVYHQAITSTNANQLGVILSGGVHAILGG